MSSEGRTPVALSLEPKPTGYYSNTRTELIDLVPRPLGRVLDVGCGEGGAAEPLSRAGVTWIGGIEILPEPAAKAAEKYNQVEVGDALETLDRFEGPFDTILCYDVLEHVVDPLALVRRLRESSSPGGHLHVSIPNARHVSLLVDLVFRGTFGYTEFGLRDSTHLRWFTRRDIVALIEGAGWSVCSTVPSLRRFPLVHRPLHVLTRGLSTEFLTGQWFVLARASSGT